LLIFNSEEVGRKRKLKGRRREGKRIDLVSTSLFIVVYQEPRAVMIGY
jgi:hypothetical protein